MGRYLAILFAAAFFAGPIHSGEVTVASASNFVETAGRLAEAFHAATGHNVSVGHGSTGQLYSQIRAGAPYDVFLAADEARPARLAEEGRSLDTATYALGAVVLVSTEEVTHDTAGEVFAGRTVALADPMVAPYGRAATFAMEALKLDTATFRPVLVANVGQVATLFRTGNADLAFVSRAQAEALDAPHVLLLDGLIAPVRQDASLLADTEAARAFWAFLQSDEGRAIIADSGYDLP